jgi:hypothetical protein
VLSSLWRVLVRLFLGGLFGTIVGFYAGALIVYLTREDCPPDSGAGCAEEGQYVPLALAALGLVVGVILALGLMTYAGWRRRRRLDTAPHERRT